MKRLITSFLLLSLSQLPEANTMQAVTAITDSTTNIVIITIDGFRWQELFAGADEKLINDVHFTGDTATAKMLYWENDIAARRKKLLPFLWNVVANKGQLYGNRAFGNNMNVANIYAVSYPGYNEMFTGTTDITVANNNKVNNSNTNIFEYLNGTSSCRGKIGIFTSWNVFPFILNKKRAGITMNCGYEDVNDPAIPAQQALNELQHQEEHKATRQDMITFLAAKQYLQQYRPRVLYIGLGETDEYAHAKNYGMYLQKANETDHLIAQLWQWLQSTPGNINNTTLIITTDHGRGTGKKWTSHGPLITGSSQTWMAVMGKNISPAGEMKSKGQLYQKQIAQTIAHLMGGHFGNQQPAVQTIAMK